MNLQITSFVSTSYTGTCNFTVTLHKVTDGEGEYVDSWILCYKFMSIKYFVTKRSNYELREIICKLSFERRKKMILSFKMFFVINHMD